MIIENGKITAATILVVDDDQEIREALAEGLSLAGVKLTIVTAHNAVTAIQRAKQDKPDVIILDYNMPMGDGFALAEAIRATPSLANTKMIMLTSQDTTAKRWESVEKEIDAFIAKPFNFIDVEAQVFSLLSKTIEQTSTKKT